MRQNKLDSNFAKKLREREIKPTEKAWDRLDAMLSLAEEKPRKARVNWLYIAAALFVGSFIAFQFYNAEPLIDSRVTNVDSKSVIKENTPSKNNLNSKELIVQKPGEQSNIVANAEIKKNLETIKNPIKITKKEIQSSTNPDSPETIIENPKAQIAAVILPTTTIEKEPQFNINPTLKSPSRISVSGASLLAVTDGELNLTFREKVINKIAKASTEIAQSFAERNNQ